MVARPSRPEQATVRANRRKHILIVSENGIYPQTLGGMEIRGRELVRTLQNTYDVSLLTNTSLTSSEGSELLLNIPKLPPFKERHNVAWLCERVAWLATNFTPHLLGRRRLRRNLLELQPDLIYFHKFSSIDPVILHELLVCGRPVVAWFGDQYGSQLRYFAEGSWAVRAILGVRPLALDARDRITLVFNCQFLREFYAPLFEAYSNQFVVYDGVDIHHFHPAPTPPGTARFVFLGRVAPEKGFLDFCRAMALLPRQLVGGIEVIGDGPMLRPGLNILRASGRSDLLSGVGPVPREAVPFRLRTTSILVSPSRDEGLPASAVEAMACGLGVIATDVGGTPEVIRHGETGLLIKPGDFAGLMRACRLLAERAELRQRLGWNARTFVSSHYDISMSFAATKSLIARAIDRVGFLRESQTSSRASSLTGVR